MVEECAVSPPVLYTCEAGSGLAQPIGIIHSLPTTRSGSAGLLCTGYPFDYPPCSHPASRDNKITWYRKHNLILCKCPSTQGHTTLPSPFCPCSVANTDGSGPEEVELVVACRNFRRQRRPQGKACSSNCFVLCKYRHLISWTKKQSFPFYRVSNFAVSSYCTLSILADLCFILSLDPSPDQ